MSDAERMTLRWMVIAFTSLLVLGVLFVLWASGCAAQQPIQAKQPVNDCNRCIVVKETQN